MTNNDSSKDLEVTKLKIQRENEIKKMIEFDIIKLWENKGHDANYLTLNGFKKKKAQDYQIWGYPFNLTKDEITDIYSQIIQDKNIILYETIRDPEEINKVINKLNVQYNDLIHLENHYVINKRWKIIIDSWHSSSFLRIWYIIQSNKNETFLTLVQPDWSKENIRKIKLDSIKLNPEGFCVYTDKYWEEFRFKKDTGVYRQDIGKDLILEQNYNNGYEQYLIFKNEKLDWEAPSSHSLICDVSMPYVENKEFVSNIIMKDSNEYFYTDSETELTKITLPEKYEFTFESNRSLIWPLQSFTCLWDYVSSEWETLEEKWLNNENMPKMNEWLYLLNFWEKNDWYQNSKFHFTGLFYKNILITKVLNKYSFNNYILSQNKDVQDVIYSDIWLLKDDFIILKKREYLTLFELKKFNKETNTLDLIFTGNQIELDSFINKM